MADDYDIMLVARQLAVLTRRVDGFIRARQVTRSVINTDAGTATIGEVLDTATETADAVSHHGDELELIGEADSVALEADAERQSHLEDTSDEAHAAWMRLIEAQIELDEARAELNQRLDAAEAELTGANSRLSDAEARLSTVEPRVTQALSDAADAQVEAVLAQGLLTVSPNAPTAGDGEGKPIGAVWMHRDGAALTLLYEWSALGWIPRPLSEEIVPLIAIGTGTYGTLAGSRLTAKSVGADEIAAGAIVALAAEITEAFIQSGHIVNLDVSKLVASSAVLSEAVIEKLWADVVKARFLTVTEKIITNDVIATNAIDGMTITGAVIRTAAPGAGVARLQLDSFGLRAYDSTNTVTATLTSNSGGLALDGTLRATYVNTDESVSIGDRVYLDIGSISNLTFGTLGNPDSLPLLIKSAHFSGPTETRRNIDISARRLTLDTTTVRSFRTQTLLASGGSFMNGNQTWNLSDPVSEQLSGIVLVWSSYSDGSPNDYQYHSFFIPKSLVASSTYTGFHTMSMGSSGTIKNVYISNSAVTGRDGNSTAPNNLYVLRAVYGV